MTNTRRRWRHFFNAPLTGYFESDIKDFDEAMDEFISSRGTSREILMDLIERTVSVDYCLQNIEAVEMEGNPEPIDHPTSSNV